MNFELAGELNDLLKSNQLDKAIEVAEGRLRQLPTTDFHKVLNRNLLSQSAELAEYINVFYDEATKFYKSKSGIVVDRVRQINPSTFEEEEVERVTNWDSKELKAIYCEMNGFTINYDLWFIDLFAYSFCNDLEDIGWLADFEYCTENSLTITDFEDLQSVYQTYIEAQNWEDKELEASAEICELLIILRLQELFRETHKLGKSKKYNWTELPLFVTAHDCDLIYNATNN